MNTAIELNTTGLEQTISFLRIKKMLQKLYPGQLLRVVATDPKSMNELTRYCDQTGDKLLESRLEGKKFFYTIKRKPQR